MIMVDVDQFKKVNQENGNLVADQILLDLAHLIRDGFRQRDLVWRISGEEFVIMLPNTECKHAQILAEKLLQRVREHTFEINKKKIQITISQGLACTSADHEKRVDMLLEHANQAWSLAKQQGGNQLVIWRSSHTRDEH
jgi:diguanylate cyclase (GGDEF)-like protein